MSTKIDHTATVNELGQILRGEHAAWEGDRRMNGYRFAVRISNDMPVAARTLAEDIRRNLADFADNSGVSPSTLLLFARILEGSDGPL